MKKLYTILDRTTGKTLDEFFSNKDVAKNRRDELNGERPDDPNAMRFVVAHGPDHRGGASQ